MSRERSPKPATTRPPTGETRCYGFWLLYPSMEVSPPERVSSSAEAGNTANTWVRGMKETKKRDAEQAWE
eukprot:418854-Prymnesium_polylepis.1